MNRSSFIRLVLGSLLVLLICGCSTGSDTPSDTTEPSGPPNGGTQTVLPAGSYPAEINTEATQLTGNRFYIDPLHGSMTGDGSESSPWGSLQDVIEAGLISTQKTAVYPYEDSSQLEPVHETAPVKAGDTLVLRTGYHGEVEIRGAFNTDYINVIADIDHKPALGRLKVSAAAKWRFSGLTISPALAPSYSAGTLVHLESHGWHGPVSDITVEDCYIYSMRDTSGWSQEDWNTLAASGISAGGDRMTIRNNYLENINFGITQSGNFGLIKGNTIANFAGDGLRGLGNDLYFEYNTVKNCYDVNGNHDDGFQSFSVNGAPPRERVVLRGNIIINYEDPNQPFRGTLQGIGCFDGMYIDWVIENNLVVTDHWHGISLYGAQNCRIVNNTVVDINGDRPGPCAIRVTDHKDGTPSTNCLVRNNIANSFSVSSEFLDNNLTISPEDYTNLFVDPANLSFYLKEGTSVIDTGTSALAPTIDQEGVERPQGLGVDLGAFEYQPSAP